MAAQSYYNPQLTFNNNTSQDVPLKPMQLANPTTVSVHTTHTTGTSYNSLPPDPSHARLESADRRLKARIRLLRLLSRIIATILSISTLVPLLMTLVKFFQTKNTEYTLQDGTKRTAWPAEPITWYTYMYTAISAVSTLFNLGVMVGYLKAGVRGGNKVAEWGGKFEYFVIGANVVVWALSVGIYRYGKEPVDGKFRDLWGWTCSDSAQRLQGVLVGVDFEKFCGVQTSAFSIGVTNVVTTLLSLFILALVMMRRKSKGKVKRAMMRGEEFEPLRS